MLSTAQQLFILPLIAFGIGLGNSMFAIGLNSQLPYWVDISQRVTTNAWITSMAAAGAVFGSLVSGLLVVGSGFQVVFVANIAAYLFAAILILPLRFLSKPEVSIAKTQRNEWHDLIQGLRGSPLLACMLQLTMIDTLGSAAHNVGFPIFSKLLTPA